MRSSSSLWHDKLTSWGQSRHKGSLLLSNHKAPPAPKRPGLWPIRRRSAESEGTSTTDKMFDFHPSHQTILSILAGLLETCTLDSKSQLSLWIPVNNKKLDGIHSFSFRSNLLLQEKQGGCTASVEKANYYNKTNTRKERSFCWE